LQAQVAGLKNQIALSEEARAAAEGERDQANGKLAEATKQIIAAEPQRDDALNQLKTESQVEPAQAFFASNLDLGLNRVNFGQNLPVRDDSKTAEESLKAQQQI